MFFSASLTNTSCSGEQLLFRCLSHKHKLLLMSFFYRRNRCLSVWKPVCSKTFRCPSDPKNPFEWKQTGAGPSMTCVFKDFQIKLIQESWILMSLSQFCFSQLHSTIQILGTILLAEAYKVEQSPGHEFRTCVIETGQLFSHLWQTGHKWYQ